MTEVKKIYLYPLWIRIWHIINAIMFLCLILTGISLQYSGETSFLIDFETSISVHNVCGITLTLNYIFYFIVNFASGNYKYYIPTFNGSIKRLVKQFKYYAWGSFNGEENPFHASAESKFNPLQKITYVKIMYVAMPLIIITGLGLLFPEILIDEFLGESGLLYTAFLHTIVGFLLSLFMVGHIYLGTTGKTMSEHFRAIITGWHETKDDK